jgi:intracellular multiplication protein IcmX
MVNAFANMTFSSPSYQDPSTQQQGGVSVNNLIDQQSYQADPVSQAVLNILGTPDYSYCMNYEGTSWTDCSLIYDNLVMANIIGKLPGTSQFFTYQYNQQFLSQLNSDTLIAPLLYSTASSSTSTSSSQPTTNGLPAQNQAQQAADFIRYASGAALPIALPKLKDYDTLYTQAVNAAKNVPQTTQMQAQAST